MHIITFEKYINTYLYIFIQYNTIFIYNKKIFFFYSFI